MSVQKIIWLIVFIVIGQIFAFFLQPFLGPEAYGIMGVAAIASFFFGYKEPENNGKKVNTK